MTYNPIEICDNGVPVLRSNNIKNQKICWDDLVRVNSDILEKQYLQEGDLLICARNGSRNLVGKCALINNLTEPVSFGAFMAVCRSKYNPWLYYILHTDYFNRYLDDSNSTAINQVTQKMLLAFPIPFPPQEEQLRIVSEIEQWFALINDIETNKFELQEFIKQTKSKILDLAIHGKLVPQDSNDEPAIDLLKRINPAIKPCDTSHYGNLPKGWCIVRLGDIYNHTTGKALKKSNTYGVLRKYITTSNLYWNSFDLTEVRSMYFTDEEIEKCTVHKGDLLLCNGGDVGRAAIWNYDEDICIQNHISRLRSKHIDVVDNLFYCYVFGYLKQKGKLNGKGVAITSLSATDILSIPIPLPPIQEQKRIVKRLSEIFSNINEIIAEL